MTITNDREIYYDPFNKEIDKDPHPLWRRMRDEAPVYYSERWGFYALSRYEDVVAAHRDWETYSKSSGMAASLAWDVLAV